MLNGRVYARCFSSLSDHHHHHHTKSGYVSAPAPFVGDVCVHGCMCASALVCRIDGEMEKMGEMEEIGRNGMRQHDRVCERNEPLSVARKQAQNRMEMVRTCELIDIRDMYVCLCVCVCVCV